MTKAHLDLMLILINGRMARAQRSERGASAVEWVVITALIVGVALLIGGILSNTLETKASSIDLDTNLKKG